MSEPLVNTETHERINNALLITTSELDAAEQLNAVLLKALKIAAPYLAKATADGMNTVVRPEHALRVIEDAIESAEARNCVLSCGHGLHDTRWNCLNCLQVSINAINDEAAIERRKCSNFEEIMTKRFRFLADDDGHTYLIPVGRESDFHKWLNAGPYWEDYSGEDFQKYATGCPTGVYTFVDPKVVYE